MSRACRAAPWLALLACLIAAPGAARAAAVPWQEAFAADSDTVIAIGAGGELVRGPFHLAAAETLWRPAAGERLARVRVSPNTGRIAWLSRPGDRFPTTLWVADGSGVRRVMAFASLVPSDLGTLRYEPAGPTVEDDGVLGARLLAPPRGTRAGSMNAFAFRSGDDALLFGAREGLGIARTDTARPRLASRALVTSLVPLDPAPIVLAEVLRLGETRWQDPTGADHPFGPEPPARVAPPGSLPYEAGGREERRAASVEFGRYLLYATASGVRVFPAGTLDARDRWTASEGTVWWSEGRQVFAVEGHDPNPRVVAEDRRPVVWLGYDPGLRGLLRATGARVVWRTEGIAAGQTGAVEKELLALTAPIVSVLRAAGDDALGLVTADSLVLWTPATGVREAAALGGVAPTALLRLEGGLRIVVGRAARGDAPLPHRLVSGRLIALEGAPARLAKEARVVRSPGGGALIVYVPGTRPPGTLHVWRPDAGWKDVENPGLIGWEPLTPWSVP